MMIYPPITELVKKTGSRYALVIETAKRTRQLVEGAQKLSDVKTSKDVTVAVMRIRLKWFQTNIQQTRKKLLLFRNSQIIGTACI